MLLFVIGLVIPWIIQIGPARLSVYRIVLLVTLVPSLFMWATGRAGKIRVADIALLVYSFWSALGLIVLTGASDAIQPSAIIILETVGSYFLARCYIRDADDFYNMVSLLFKAIAIFLPLAMIETYTGRNVTLDLFGLVFPTPVDSVYDPRWGLRRVQAFVEHPILFGVFAGSIFSMVHLVLGYRKSFLQRFKKSGIIVATAFLSLSAGPLTALLAQVLLVTWDRLFRGNKARWKILWGLVFAMYVFVALVSNQSVPEFYISHFSFDELSAFYRVLIWRYGSTSALNNPLFGVPMNAWERPEWMPPSIDMFWLIHAVEHGLLAAFMMLLAFVSLFWSVSFKRRLSEKLVEYRTAYLTCMIGFFLVGWTVHFWNATYVLFLFLMGSGVWILDAKKDGDTAVRARSSRLR